MAISQLQLGKGLYCAPMSAFAVAIGGKADMGWCTAYVR